MINRTFIIALNKKWVGISRLPEGLKRSGFQITALCPEGSYLSKTKYLDSAITYPTWTYSRSKLIYLVIFYHLIRLAPQVVIPGDEDALLALQRMAFLLRGFGIFNNRLKALYDCVGKIELGSEKLSKSLFIARCEKIGVQVPHNVRVETVEEALRNSQRIGYPVVVKFDFGYGASGVNICQNEDEVKSAFENFKQKSLKVKIKTWIRHLLFVVQDTKLEGVSVQQYLKGQVGQIPFVALNGRVLAHNSVLKLRTYPGATGPTSVAQSRYLPEMEKAAEKVAAFYNYNGFGSLDYIIEESSAKAYVIEMNPRPTPICHFTEQLAGVDLCKAYFMELNGQSYQQPIFKDYTVALFPNEMKRQPQSEFISVHFHDVPTSDPNLKLALETE